MSEYDAELHRWWRVQVTNKEFILRGEIHNDSKQRFPNGHLIQTSGIKNTSCKDGDIIQTRNTRYKLFNEATNDQ